VELLTSLLSWYFYRQQFTVLRGGGLLYLLLGLSV
jgi:hypothetical protein